MFDYKPLVRPTKLGNTAILIFIDAFSNWPILIPVKEAAETAATAFVENVVTFFGQPEIIGTDKGGAAWYTACSTTVLARRGVSAAQSPTRSAAGRPSPAGSVTDPNRRRQTPASKPILAGQ